MSFCGTAIMERPAAGIVLRREAAHARRRRLRRASKTKQNKPIGPVSYAQNATKHVEMKTENGIVNADDDADATSARLATPR